jgi:hypothetical protein
MRGLNLTLYMSIKDRQHNDQKRKDKQRSTKIKIEKHEPHQKSEVNSGAVEGKAVPASHVAPVVLLLLQTRR